MTRQEESNRKAMATAVQRGIPLEALETTSPGWIVYPMRRVRENMESVFIAPSDNPAISNEVYLYKAENGKWYKGATFYSHGRGTSGYPHPLDGKEYNTREEALQAGYEAWDEFNGVERTPEKGWLL